MHAWSHMYTPRFMKRACQPTVENDDTTTDNYQLNVARHAFSCSMRFGQFHHAGASALPWSYHQILRYVRFFILLGFPTWVLNGVIFALPFSVCVPYHLDVSFFFHG
jgi:hypothetical protein